MRSSSGPTSASDLQRTTPARVTRGSTVRLRGKYDPSTGHFTFVNAEADAPPPPPKPTTTTTPAGESPLAKGVSASVERWHFPMINDERRNRAYDEEEVAAMKAAVEAVEGRTARGEAEPEYGEDEDEDEEGYGSGSSYDCPSELLRRDESGEEEGSREEDEEDDEDD